MWFTSSGVGYMCTRMAESSTISCTFLLLESAYHIPYINIYRNLFMNEARVVNLTYKLITESDTQVTVGHHPIT